MESGNSHASDGPSLSSRDRQSAHDGDWAMSGEMSRLNLTLAEAARQAETTLRDAQCAELVGHRVRELAHRFNNLLTIMQSSAELLRLPNLSEQRRERYLNAIEETTGRAAGLTRELQTLAHGLAPRRRTFDIMARIKALPGAIPALGGATISAAPAHDDAWMINVDPDGFGVVLAMLANAARGPSPQTGTGSPTNLALSLAHAQERPAWGDQAAAAGRFVALTLSERTPRTAGGCIARHFVAILTQEQDLAPEWLQTFGFLRQNGGALQGCRLENDGLGLTLYLPCADADDGRETPPDRNTAGA